MPAGIWLIHPDSVKWVCGVWFHGSCLPAFRKCGHSSAIAATPTAATSRSPAVECVRPSRMGLSGGIGGRATGCCWRSWRARRRNGNSREGCLLFTPFRPSGLVSGLDLLHHPLKSRVQVNRFAVRHTDQNEEDVGHLHGEITCGLLPLLRLLPEP